MSRNTVQTLPDDPNVKIPPAVQATIDRSAQLFEELKDAPGDVDPGNVTQQGNPQEPPVTSQGNPEPAAEQVPPQPSQPPQSSQPETQGEDDENDESWKRRYQAEHGRLAKMRAANQELAERNANLERVISMMQLAAPAPAEPSDPAVDEDVKLTPDELNDYGEDFLNVVGKKARQEIAPLLKGYQTEIARLTQQVASLTGQSMQSAKDKMHAELDKKLPQWKEINRDERFLDWLGLPDSYSGVIRHNMLKEAYGRDDTQRVLAFFNGFLAQEAAVAPAGGEPDPTTTTVDKVPLESLAAPGRAKTAAPASAPAEKPIFTRAQIAAFYADVNQGKYRDRPAEKDKIERQIFAAQSDGRIR